MAKNIHDLVPANTSGGDLAPLFANDSFTRAANDELNRIDAAERAAAAKIAVDDNYRGTVTLFASATSSLRAISAKFPESSKFIDAAIKSTQLAMSAVAGNPIPAVDPHTVPAAGSATLATWIPKPIAPAPVPQTNDENLAKIRAAAAKARAGR